MRLSQLEQIGVLAAGTGLLLIAIFFVALALGAHTPGWLPMMIAAIAGFEFWLFAQDHARAFLNRRGGR